MKITILRFLAVAVTIIFALLIGFSLRSAQTPISVTLHNKETLNDLFITEPIELKFDNLNSKTNLQFIFDPELDVTTSWNEEESVISIHTEPKNFNQVYYLRVIYNDYIIFKDYLKTKNFNTLTPQEKNELSIIYPQIVSQIELTTDRSWVEKLPFISERYIIIYDFDNKHIRVRIPDSNLKTKTEIDKLKEEAAIKLVNLGVPQYEEVLFILD